MKNLHIVYEALISDLVNKYPEEYDSKWSADVSESSRNIEKRNNLLNLLNQNHHSFTTEFQKYIVNAFSWKLICAPIVQPQAPCNQKIVQRLSNLQEKHTSCADDNDTMP